MKKIIAPLSVVLLVTLMYAVADISSVKEIIFPEIAALSIGTWYIKNSAWTENIINIWLSPTLAALTGVVMGHFLRYPQAILIISAFIVVGFQLYILRSNVLPSISAAILPIVLNVQTLYYPLSVCIFTGIIAAGSWSVNYFRLNSNSSSPIVSDLNEDKQRDWELTGITYWLRLLVGVVCVTIIAFQTKWIYIISPPLIVSFIEYANESNHPHGQPVRLFLLIFSAAASGMLLVSVTNIVVHFPLWASAVVIVVWMFYLFRLFRFAFPPAVAVALLPTIINTKMLLFFPLQVGVGITLFMVLEKILVKPKRTKWFELRI